MSALESCKTQYEEFLYPHIESINTIFYKLFILEYFRTPSKCEITNRWISKLNKIRTLLRLPICVYTSTHRIPTPSNFCRNICALLTHNLYELSSKASRENYVHQMWRTGLISMACNILNELFFNYTICV